MSESESLEQRRQTALELADAFRMERMACVGIIVACVVVILGCVVWGVIKGELEIAAVLSMFGSGGVMAFLLGHLMKMYDRSMDLVAGKQS